MLIQYVTILITLILSKDPVLAIRSFYLYSYIYTLILLMQRNQQIKLNCQKKLKKKPNIFNIKKCLKYQNKNTKNKFDKYGQSKGFYDKNFFKQIKKNIF